MLYEVITNFSSGSYMQRYHYKSFEPIKIDLPWQIDLAELNMLLSQANLKLGELNAFSQLIPDIDFFIKMHVLKEGTQSSRIEGTQTNIDEAIQKEEYIQPEKKDDWQEVQNYVEAMNYAIDCLNTLPLSNRLLKQTHKLLLQGVRGTQKLPGEFRQSQNWIGGSSLADATFIPPHQDSVPELMGDLDVITSYSIHYTKLYDTYQIKCDKQSTNSSVSIQKRVDGFELIVCNTYFN